jgi:hypothetical protein
MNSKGAVAQRADCRVDRFIAAEDHHRRRDMLAQHPFHDFQPMDVGQIEVQDQDVDVAAVEAAEGFPPGAAFLDAAPWRCQQLSIGRADSLLVVDDQDAAGLRLGPGPAAKNRRLLWPSSFLLTGVSV